VTRLNENGCHAKEEEAESAQYRTIVDAVKKSSFKKNTPKPKGRAHAEAETQVWSEPGESKRSFGQCVNVRPHAKVKHGGVKAQRLDGGKRKMVDMQRKSQGCPRGTFREKDV